MLQKPKLEIGVPSPLARLQYQWNEFGRQEELSHPNYLEQPKTMESIPKAERAKLFLNWRGSLVHLPQEVTQFAAICKCSILINGTRPGSIIQAPTHHLFHEFLWLTVITKIHSFIKRGRIFCHCKSKVLVYIYCFLADFPFFSHLIAEICHSSS